MDSQRYRLARRQPVAIGAQALVVNAVAGLMQNAKERAAEVMLVVARGDAAIVRAMAGAKWMGRCVAASAVKIEAEARSHVFGEAFLGIDRIAGLEDFDFGMAAGRLDFGDERDELLAKSRKNAGDARC